MVFGIKTNLMVYFKGNHSVNAGKILWRPKFGRFSQNLAILGHFGPILAIQTLFGSFMQNEVIFKQYFLYGQTDTILF